MAVYLIDQLKQKNNGKFPLMDANDILGGYYIVENIDERNNIPDVRRKQGMLCWVNGTGDSDGVLYQLIGGIKNENWISAQLGVKEDEEPDEEDKNIIPEGYSLVWVGDSPPENQDMLWVDTSTDGVLNDEKDIDTVNELLSLVKEMKNEISSLKQRVKYLEEHGSSGLGGNDEEEIFEDILFENGESILLENGDELLLEQSTNISKLVNILLENGDDLLLENGDKIII